MSSWEKVAFSYQGTPYPASVAKPEQACNARSWAWRPEFRDAFTELDDRLLQQGWHLLFVDLPDQYGSPHARSVHQAFLRKMQQAFHLAEQGLYIGLSRGGLSALHQALDAPEQCLGLYLDNPVCDPGSWPGGEGEGPGSPSDREKLMQAYGDSLSDSSHPLSRLTPSLARQLPLALIGARGDEIVPWEENGRILLEHWQQAQATLYVELNPHGKHHPHGSRKLDALVAFVETL